jgi:hypothetical protein
MQETASGAMYSGATWLLLMIQGKLPAQRAKLAHLLGHLPITSRAEREQDASVVFRSQSGIICEGTGTTGQ